MKKIFLWVIGSFMLWSCNDAPQKPSPETNQPEHHHGEPSAAIQLNNGAKWAMSEEMKLPLSNGEELVNYFIAANQTNYTELAQQLKEQNDLLIKGCSMKGTSHDELHKWLHPHLELVKALEKTSDETEATEIVLKLQHSFMLYHEYFE